MFTALHCFWWLSRQLQIYGAARHHYTVTIARSQVAKNAMAQSSRWVLQRSSWLSRLWSCVITLLILWTGVVSVFEFCFSAVQSQFWQWSEGILGAICALDIGMSLIRPFKDESHALVTEWRKIAVQYARGWLIPDILAW